MDCMTQGPHPLSLTPFFPPSLVLTLLWQHRPTYCSYLMAWCWCFPLLECSPPRHPQGRLPHRQEISSILHEACSGSCSELQSSPPLSKVQIPSVGAARLSSNPGSVCSLAAVWLGGQSFNFAEHHFLFCKTGYPQDYGVESMKSSSLHGAKATQSKHWVHGSCRERLRGEGRGTPGIWEF